MHYSSSKLFAICNNILDYQILDVVLAGSGGNSRIYKVTTPTKNFALKFYREDSGNNNARLIRELNALEFMNLTGDLSCPILTGHNLLNNCCLTEWIDGEVLEVFEARHLEEAGAFLKKIHLARTNKSASKIDFGTEVCLSAIDIERQIKSRIKKLQDSHDDNLKNILENKFNPILNQIIVWVKKEYLNKKWSYESKISNEKLTLSPVDFGFHNALHTKSDRLIFLDFEYFGWSDPAHLISDTLLHPGMDLNDEQKNIFFNSISETYSSDKDFLSRIAILYPLYALRWCAIMLNIFMPSYFDSFPKKLSNNEKLEMLDMRLDKVNKRLKIADDSKGTFPF